MVAAATPRRHVPSLSGQAIGRRFRMIRSALGFSQRQFGELLGIGGSSISLIERGCNIPRRSIVELLRIRLLDPRLQARLVASGYGNALDELHIGDEVARVLSSRPEHCNRCGLLLTAQNRPTEVAMTCNLCLQELEAEGQSRSRKK